VGFGRYLLKVLVGRKVEGQVGRSIDGGGRGGNRWVSGKSSKTKQKKEIGWGVGKK